ncbi:MAG: FAD-binding protein [Erysipelotrichales bacterium]|nr:FAD-binding protein [Erysipelotrichales bacterium]
MKKIFKVILASFLVVACVSGCAKEDKPTNTVPTVEYDSTKTADVVIIGAGGAGLSAAISAVDNGAESVLVIEKTGMTGGALNFTSGSMSGAGTIIQELDGIEDTVESYVQDILKNGAYKGNEELIRAFAEANTPMINWLWENGMSDNKFTMADGKRSVFAPEHALYSVARTYKASPDDAKSYKSAAHEVLDQYIKNNLADKVTFDFNTEATQLINNEQGQVLSVLGTNATTGETVLYTANKGVIMATGGYSGNSVLMGEYAEYGDQYLVGGSAGADGYGIYMMQQVGAKVDEESMSYIPTFPMGRENQPGKGVIAPSYMWKAGAICVNQEGERFVDETSADVELREVALEEQTNAIQYDIFTDNVIEDTVALNASVFWNFYYRDGMTYSSAVVKANSLEELAGKLNIPYATLAATVEDYNKHVESGETDEFGRRYTEDSLNTYNMAINKIEGETYYAIPLKALCVMTLGGVTINTSAQVLDEAGNVIPGLYAAGECTNVWGRFVSGGTGVMGPITFGNIAGKTAMTTELATDYIVKPASFIIDEKLFETPEVSTGSRFDMTRTLKDGEYTATVDGQEGKMTVKTTISGGKIAAVEVVENHETQSIATAALEGMPTRIVTENSVDVDGFAGATLTSNRILDAVTAGLEEAAK